MSQYPLPSACAGHLMVLFVSFNFLDVIFLRYSSFLSRVDGKARGKSTKKTSLQDMAWPLSPSHDVLVCGYVREQCLHLEMLFVRCYDHHETYYRLIVLRENLQMHEVKLSIEEKAIESRKLEIAHTIQERAMMGQPFQPGLFSATRLWFRFGALKFIYPTDNYKHTHINTSTYIRGHLQREGLAQVLRLTDRRAS